MLVSGAMAAQRAEEIARRKRRRKLVKGLLIGGAAIGLPTLVNTLIQRRAGRLPPPSWGRPLTFDGVPGSIHYQHLGPRREDGPENGGEGDPVFVLLHSFGPGHGAEEWREAAELLAARHTVYVPDWPGWGRSSWPSRLQSWKRNVHLLEDFLDRVVRRPAVVVAAGQSAAYAVRAAAAPVTRPDTAGKPRIAALGLVCPSGLGLHRHEPGLPDAVVHRLLTTPLLGTSALNIYTRRAGLEEHLRDIYGRPDRVTPELVERHYAASHQRGAHRTLAAYLAGHLYLELEDEHLDRLSHPVWLAWGRRSHHPPVEEADLWLSRLPGRASLRVFEDSGRLPHAEEPAAFVEALEAFLAGLE